MKKLIVRLFLLPKKPRLWAMETDEEESIFVVFGTNKEKDPWMVCAYKSHCDAQAHAKKADEEAKKICGYSGTSYFVEESVLHSKPLS
jgi:hypothetical protein